MSEGTVDVEASDPTLAVPIQVRRRRTRQRSRLKKFVRRHRVLTIIVAVTSAVLIALLIWLFFLNKQLGDIPTFDADREEVPAGEVRNILLIGADDIFTRGDMLDMLEAGEWQPGLFRSDTILMLHLAADRQSAQVISIPRDSYVPVEGIGTTKINAAFELGGPQLLTSTVEDVTGITVDHVAVIDFQGFVDLSEAIGGVDVTVRKTVTDNSTGKVWEAGPQHLEGANALEYVRHRKGLPLNIYNRDQRQQNFLRAVLDKVVQPQVVLNPLRLTRLLQSLEGVMAVDETLTPGVIRSLALQSRDLRTSNVRFVSAPHVSNPLIDGAYVVTLDLPFVREMFAAVDDDRFESWFLENPAAIDSLPAPALVR